MSQLQNCSEQRLESCMSHGEGRVKKMPDMNKPTTRLLMTFHFTISARICMFWLTTWQHGALYDVISNIGTILKVTGKRVPGGVDSAL